MNKPKTLIVCGALNGEVKRVLPDLVDAIDRPLCVRTLEAALDTDEAGLMAAINNAAVNGADALLYGCHCHSAMGDIAEHLDAKLPDEANCAEIILGTERKKALDEQGNHYYLTASSFLNWKRIFVEQHHWDKADALMNFGSFDSVIVLDTGIAPITDEGLLEFYDYVQVPVETLVVGLDNLKRVLLAML
jgi:hypothetical protein